MDVVIERGSKDADIAVIRNYAPARIERELLAQVFEIVQRSESLRVARSGHSQPPVETTSIGAINDNSTEHAQDNLCNEQRIALEPAA